jgi:hypothetical protein
VHHPRRSAAELEARLRTPAPPALPVLGRIEGGRLWLDLRAVAAAELPELIAALAALGSLGA